MKSEYINLDKIDRGIVNFLIEYARMSFAEIAKQLDVSTGTIHIRVKKMKKPMIKAQIKLNVKQR